MGLTSLFLKLMKDKAFVDLVAQTDSNKYKAFTTFNGVFYPGRPNYYLGVAVIDPGVGKIVGAFSHLHPYTVVRRTWKTDRLEWDECHSIQSEPTEPSQS